MTQMPFRRSEEYPLLSPDSGGEKPLEKPAIIPVEWNVSCTPKRPSWISRWPQFVSACWLSVVLLTIMFVIFYAFGSIYRLQSVMLKYESKPTGEVYYHYVLPRDNSVQFKTFTNYLSFMATEYPLLNFNVRLLIDNAPQSPTYILPRDSLFSETFFPEYTGSVRYVFIKNNDRDIQEFQRKHLNVNVSVLSLSKYTANTPLRYRWRSIPVAYLSFYVSAYEVWKNGGIGLNLWTQNYRFHLMKHIDFKLDAILKQHSKSVDLPKYTQALDKIDVIDEKEFFALFFDAFNEIPRMFQTIYHFGIASDNGDIRTVPMTSVKVKRSISSNEIIENTSANDTKANVSSIKTHDTISKENESNDTTQMNNTTDVNNITDTIQNNNSRIVKQHEYPNNGLHFHVTYEISRLMDNIAAFVDIENTPNFYNKNYQKNYLTLSSDGTIMVAYSRNHPFLSKILFKPRSLISPRYVISNTFQESCFRSNRADYCDSIKILNYL